ncbi:hypothetical protein VOLCADRAFT_95164 [Volvox carteri f. nagariensis]|uniref:Uncharacterized protein n=1 Tax=Volvox carteri f. nagariensis TaxID=3068 RepID=D8U6S3_VOLCA|nr:uncharacterized protein VOLCADRAFT_95164 [Volvox carteri f. nagariensis]EFJ44561.1 hypothetical protein VOLCADRAFT_95164 [Volvox carteri f. nagariensis]|eukprot:XP_002954411.1 hypothetical protein VOLCADRAFT_95164 [Volvox carteri f. nagariensis]
MQDVANLFRSCLPSLETSKVRVKVALKSFVDANDNPSTSSNYTSSEEDPVEVYLDMLQHGVVRRDATWMLLLFRALKILSRKKENRIRFGPAGLRGVVSALVNPHNNRVAAEGSNVLLNVCYEIDNVEALLETPGVQQLLLFLMEDDEELQANAAGAIQSICFQEDGRRHVHQKGGIAVLAGLLTSPNAKVVTRAVGAMHNLSSYAEAIRDIRASGSIPTLVALLHNGMLPISGSAAGALQNVSREVASRLIIRELDAVPPLARLLSAPDVQAQVCASGALLNIVGPDLDQREREQRQLLFSSSRRRPGQRRALGRLMALCMAAGAIYDCLFEEPPPLAPQAEAGS